jgi:hypothetical protein
MRTLTCTLLDSSQDGLRRLQVVSRGRVENHIALRSQLLDDLGVIQVTKHCLDSCAVHASALARARVICHLVVVLPSFSNSLAAS